MSWLGTLYTHALSPTAMADKLTLRNDDSREPTLAQTKSHFSGGVTNWREYARSYAQDLHGYEVLEIENNICSGARPSYVPGDIARMWFLPLELASQVNAYHAGMLEKVTVCYDLVDAADGSVLSAEGLRWPADVTGAKVSFEKLQEVDYSAFESEDLVKNVIYNIIFSRQIMNKVQRDSYLLFSLTNASLLVPPSVALELKANGKRLDMESGLEDHYERFVFLFLFLRVTPHIVGEVATPEFYTTCLRFWQLRESWQERGEVDYLEALCLKAVYELEMATEQPHGGLLFYRVSNLEYYPNCGFEDVEGVSDLMPLCNKMLELDEFSPLASPTTEHRASDSVSVGNAVYKSVIQGGSMATHLSQRNVGVQARISGKSTCMTTFKGRPATLAVKGGSFRLLRVDMSYVLKTIAWALANNPVYALDGIENPAYGGLESNRLVVQALNMGLFGESGTAFILCHLVYGDVKVSSNSRNRLFKALAQDEEGVKVHQMSRPAFTQQLAAVSSAGKIHLALAAEIILELKREGARWHVQSSHRSLRCIDGLGQFRTGRALA